MSSTGLRIFALLTALMSAVARAQPIVDGNPVASGRLPVILDTDIGDDMDDSWALVMLLRNPRIDLKLITTTNGRADYRSNLIAKFLSLANRTEIPIGMGAGRQGGVGGQQPWLHGFDRKNYRGRIDHDGVRTLVDMVQRSNERVTIIAIGPLQTLAAALKLNPVIAKKVSLVGMQGSVFWGYNGSPRPTAEYNVKIDPAAAREVLSAPWHSITITPLDTCGLKEIKLTGNSFAGLLAEKDPLMHGLMESYAAWENVRSISALTESSTLFDTVAVYLADPAGHPALELRSLRIRVDADGKTVVDPGGALMQVATQWKNVDAFPQYLTESLKPD